MMPEVCPLPFTGSPIERTPPQYVPMPPPFDASQTFSVQVPTMPPRLSSTEFRKHEIGSPRCVPPLLKIGVAGMNQSFDM
jgi:hypothetical protein